MDDRLQALSRALLAWYRRAGRDLPWRRTRDPYRILVSEVMLQQTQVPRVLLFYKKWLRQFPSWKRLAAADNAQVIRAWAGLGYNRRALALRDIARQVVERGAPPRTAAEWQELRGIGPYTAAALATFTRAEPALPIDTNIRRVLGRALLGKPFPQPNDDDRIRRAARDLLTSRDFHDIPQALFDLATMICKKSPDCAACPLRTHCPAARKFLAGSVRIPKQMIKKSVERRHRDKPYPDRIYRGRILKLVRESRTPVPLATIGPAVDPSFDSRHDQAWIAAMAQRLVADGLISRSGGRFRLAV